MSFPSSIFHYGHKFETAHELVFYLLPKLGLIIAPNDLEAYVRSGSLDDLHNLRISDIDIMHMFYEWDIRYKRIGDFVLILGEKEQDAPPNNTMTIDITHEQAKILISCLYADAAAIADALYSDVRSTNNKTSQEMQDSARNSLSIIDEMKSEIELINLITKAIEETDILEDIINQTLGEND